MEEFKFDDKHIKWVKLAYVEQMVYSIFNSDEEKNIIDVMIKLKANNRIILHRHKALNRSVNQDLELSKKRDEKLNDDELCTEYGSNKEIIIILKVCRSEGVIYELLDDGSNTITTLTYQRFVDIWKHNSE